MVAKRMCKERNQSGEPCGQNPLRDIEFCFWHDPDHKEEAAEARKLGGRRRRREGTVAGAYEFDGLESVRDIRRLIEIAVTDTLSLENSVGRNRALAGMAQTAAKLLEVGELEDRLVSLERTVAEGSDERGNQAD